MVQRSIQNQGLIYSGGTLRMGQCCGRARRTDLMFVQHLNEFTHMDDGSSSRSPNLKTGVFCRVNMFRDKFGPHTFNRRTDIQTGEFIAQYFLFGPR